MCVYALKQTKFLLLLNNKERERETFFMLLQVVCVFGTFGQKTKKKEKRGESTSQRLHTKREKRKKEGETQIIERKSAHKKKSAHHR